MIACGHLKSMMPEREKNVHTTIQNVVALATDTHFMRVKVKCI